jgi:hypothetical protein
MAVTLSEFARHVGVSRQAVAKVVAKGGLGDLVVWSTGPKGKRVGAIADVEKATLVWRSRSGSTSVPAAQLNGRLSAHARAAKRGQAASSPASPRAHQAPPDDGEPEEDDPLESIAMARLQLESYKAKLERLEFEKGTGLVVETAKAKEIYGRQIQAAKTKFMAVARLARGRIPHLTIDDVMTIEDLCREALEELCAEALQPGPPSGEDP